MGQAWPHPGSFIADSHTTLLEDRIRPSRAERSPEDLHGDLPHRAAAVWRARRGDPELDVRVDEARHPAALRRNSETAAILRDEIAELLKMAEPKIIKPSAPCKVFSKQEIETLKKTKGSK